MAAATEMIPRYNVFWYEPEDRWAASIDQAPGMIRFGDTPEEALRCLLEVIDAIRLDGDDDGHIGQWCAVCWTTSKACDDNAEREKKLGKHREFLASIGVVVSTWDHDDILGSTAGATSD